MDYLIAIPDQLAPHLRSLRKARGLSQAQLAGKMGVTQSRIAAIERNPAAVSMGQLTELLRVLGVHLVLRDTQPPTPHPAPPVPTAVVATPQGEW